MSRRRPVPMVIRDVITALNAAVAEDTPDALPAVTLSYGARDLAAATDRMDDLLRGRPWARKAAGACLAIAGARDVLKALASTPFHTREAVHLVSAALECVVEDLTSGELMWELAEAELSQMEKESTP